MPDINYTSNLGGCLRASHEQLLKAAEEIGQAAESHAKLYITAGVYKQPEGWYKRTGNLRNSITHVTEDNDSSVTVVIGSDVEYAPYVELGTGIYAEGGDGRGVPWSYQDDNGNWHRTSGMPPRPFIRPAIENHKKEYREILLSQTNT